MAYNNYSQRSGDRVRYDIIERIGVLGERKDGWTREVNIVAWNGGQAKVDIRDWAPDHNRMTKGVTLLEDEAENLVKALAARYGFMIGSNAIPSAVYERRDTSVRPKPAAVPGAYGEQSYRNLPSDGGRAANAESHPETGTTWEETAENSLDAGNTGSGLYDDEGEGAFRSSEVAENAPVDEAE